MRKPPNARKPWGFAAVKRLESLAKGNTPTRVIALKFGRSEAAITGKAGLEGISLKPTNRSPYGTAGKRGFRGVKRK